MKPTITAPKFNYNEEDEERDPLPEPVKKRFKDRSGMGRGALLHHLPPPPPVVVAGKRKVGESGGKGKEREGSLVAEGTAGEVGGAGKRRRVELDGSGEVGVQRIERKEVEEVIEKVVELSVEQVNRNVSRVACWTARRSGTRRS